MNIQISNLTGSTAIASPLIHSPASMVALVDAYRRETVAMDDLSVSRSEEEEKQIEERRAACFAALRDAPPRVRTIADVISALELARDDVIADDIGGFVPSILDALLAHFKSAHVGDAMLTLVGDYRALDAAYCNAPLDISREEEDRLGHASNVPFFKLRDETPEITSLAGAVAAIELAYEAEVKDGEDFCGGGFGPSLLKAALAYLRPSTSCAAAPDPVFQAIEEFQAAAKAFSANRDDKQEDALFASRCEKLDALAAMIATTPAGMRAQLQALHKDEQGCLVDCGSSFVAALLNIVNHQLGMSLTLPE